MTATPFRISRIVGLWLALVWLCPRLAAEDAGARGSARTDMSALSRSEGILRLAGPWEFYWQKRLKPGDVLPEPDAWSMAQTYWVDLPLKDGNRPTRTGFATYRLVLDNFPTTRQAYLWQHRGLIGSGRVYLYPESQPELATVLTFGWDPKKRTKPTINQLEQRFEAHGPGRWVLLIQVELPETFGWRSGGLFIGPEVALADRAVRIAQYYSFELASCIGLNLFVGLAGLMLWIYRREELASLWIASFSFIFCLRLFFYLGLSLDWWDPHIAFSIVLDFFTRLLMFSLLLAYFASGFRDQAPSQRWIHGAFALNGIAAFCVVLSLFDRVPILFSTRLSYLSHLVSLVLCGFTLAKSLRKKIPGLHLLAIGFGLFLLSAVHDFFALYLRLTPGMIPLLPVGITLFLASQFQLAATRFARSLAKVEEFAKEIADKEKARTLFFQNTSHELRTPLNGILGFLELMRLGRYGPVSDRLVLQISKCLRLAEGLKLQVDTILDIAKARKGGLATKMQKFSLEDMLTKTNTLAEGLLTRSSLLRFHSELDLGDKEHPYFICDKEKVFAILRNLVGNAIKFSDSKRTNDVRLKISCRPHELLIEVHDTGIGIAPEHHQKIFEEFAQVETQSHRRYEGTGLGLTMVRDFVKVLGGKLRIESALGRGTSFFISLPEGQISPALEDQNQEQTLIQSLDQASGQVTHPQALQPSSVGHGWNILVIDDNPSNCELIADILEQDSFHVRTALSGAEGLRTMRREKPHVVLLDMMMPEMSGEDVIKLMRADPELADIAVVIVTARASDEDRYLGLSLGADDYLPKPILAAELRLRLQNLIHRQKLVLQSQQIEAQAKLSQLGELFRDLSHELKNIFQGGLNGGQLSAQQVEVSLAPLDLERLNLPLMTQSLIDGTCMIGETPRSFPLSEGTGRSSPQIRNLGQLLASFPFPEEEWALLVQELQNKPNDELLFLENQLNLLFQVRSLQQSLLLGRELALSTLAYTRPGSDPIAFPHESLKAVQAMTRARVRRHHITLYADITESPLAIFQGHLMQIMLNLVLNAIDAVQTLNPEDRWIRILARANADHTEFTFQNGGPCIPPDVQAKLFQRGFSTKGSQGSGIGLHVSSKLAREAHGNLTYDGSAPNPCFILLLPAAREDKVEAAS